MILISVQGVHHVLGTDEALYPIKTYDQNRQKVCCFHITLPQKDQNLNKIVLSTFCFLK